MIMYMIFVSNTLKGTLNKYLGNFILLHAKNKYPECLVIIETHQSRGNKVINVFLYAPRNVYQSSDAATTGIDGNRKAPCLGNTPNAQKVPSLTQRYGLESLSQQ